MIAERAALDSAGERLAAGAERPALLQLAVLDDGLHVDGQKRSTEKPPGK